MLKTYTSAFQQEEHQDQGPGDLILAHQYLNGDVQAQNLSPGFEAPEHDPGAYINLPGQQCTLCVVGRRVCRKIVGVRLNR